MNNTKLALLIARIIAGLFYLYAGVDNLVNLPEKVGYATFKGVPFPWILVTAASLLVLVGGLSLLTGYRPELGVAAIVLFLVPVTIMMHDFWTVADPQVRIEEMRSFRSNMALAGSAVLFLAVPRPWAWRVENLVALFARNERQLRENVA